MPAKRKYKPPLENPRTVRLECYRMSDAEVDDLRDFLSVADGIEILDEVASRKSSGLVELGTLIYAQPPAFFAAYAAGKVLDYVHDEALAWFKRKRREPAFITLELSGTKKRKKIGEGRPRQPV